MGRDTKLAVVVAVVFIGAGVWYLASDGGEGAKEPSQDSGATPKVVADKPAGPAKPTTPRVQPRQPSQRLTDARPTGAPTTRPVTARPRPLPAPSPLAASPASEPRTETVSSPSASPGPVPSPVRRPQPAPTDSMVPVGPAVADTATPRSATIGTLAADPVITPATRPAGETAGPVRHPLARRADEPATVTSAAIAPATPAAQTKVHTIAAGDTFSGLALKYLGHVKYTTEIVKANPGLDPTRLRLGAKVKIPTLPAAASQPAVAAGASPAASPATGARGPIVAAPAVRAAPRPVPADRAYTVKAGDAWYGLAQRFLGDGNEWPRLFELNKERLSGNREVLPAGVVIELPRDAKIPTTTTN
ncbi:MAG: LysM peptidoglycan-binding domain-containing protein [Phycisphaerae bacterium]|nr:LysM peptidoglycan-binding domain-containing protein [Phycisphaerae bacterium]